MMQSSYITGEHYRITVLTPALIRLEYSHQGRFEDRPTQVIQNRSFPVPDYQVWKTEHGIELHTDSLNLFYDEKPFSRNGLWIENRSECRGIYCTWHFGDELYENLGGTARTLDEADGAVPLEPGILSRLQGYSVLDDSHSYALTEEGWLDPPEKDRQDLYFFSYGYAYQQALYDFFHLCGSTPLLPRYALGNWWSRFYRYSDQEYLELMSCFSGEKIPLSVAVVDMDWHESTDGPDWKGWTGFTWNRELLPDPKGFLNKLHQMGLHVTLNLHPAEGIQPHEEMYPEAAAALGKDAARHQRIPFDPANRHFLNVYFNDILHPREAEGVDFWWIDWQQGGICSLPDLDPLWLLNHFHTLDIGRNGKRPLILSRYAGPGSHRYPIGFSGDSVISWKSLAFQPYFTATASNIGYGWWSHDIGGHTHGKRDDELQVRWLQYGVFSPIVRLHSTNNPFNGKEPWRYSPECSRIMKHFLRLRHQLLPYLYTMNWLSHEKGKMLVQPMYYSYPKTEEAYQVPNQYFWGSEIIVAPITKQMNAILKMGDVTCWLPDGIWHDVLTGMIYHGGSMRKLFRTLEHIPVLAPAGAIIPLQADPEDQNPYPVEMLIFVFAGADGDFLLYEDDGETMDYKLGKYRKTQMHFSQETGTSFTITPEHPTEEWIGQRHYVVTFSGVLDCSDGMIASINGKPVPAKTEYDIQKHRLSISLPFTSVADTIRIDIPSDLCVAKNDQQDYWKQMLNRAQIDYELKAKIWETLVAKGSEIRRLQALQALDLPESLLDALCEVM